MFSTLKASILKVQASLLDDLEKGRLSDEEKKTLADLAFLVPDVNEEKKEILGLMAELNEINKSLSVIMVMNLDCNLSCKYCFEGQRKGKYYMTKDTADLFVQYIEAVMTSSHERVHIVFYGGEPLLSLELILYIAGKTKTLAGRKGVEFGFSLITNCTLLSPNAVNKLKPLGLESAQITLDGPREVHDLYRPYKSGKGSFDAIIRNLHDICESTDIILGGNFTEDNYRKFPKLLDYLLDNGLTPDRIPFVKFDPVTKESSEFAPPDFHEGCETINEPWLFEAGLFLREETLRRGYKTSRIRPVACMVEYRDKFVVHYNGNIYKCPGLIGREEFKVGDIRTGITDYRHSHSLDNWKNMECLDCVYLPLCFGGCRHMKLVRDGNMNGVDCKKPYLDAVLEQLVMQDIKYGAEL